MTNVTPTPQAAQTTQVYRVYIKATPEAIWQAISSPDWTQRYGYRCRTEYDLRPSGVFAVHATAQMLEMGMADVVIDGEVLEADPPRRLVQTYRFLFSPEQIAEGFTHVTFEIEPENDGMSRLTVTHRTEGAPTMAAMVAGGDSKVTEGAGGWAWILSDLKTLLETGEAMPS